MTVSSTPSICTSYGDKVGSHQGGYTGFEFDLSEYLHEGTNVLAAKVDNTWNPQLAPRAGDHNFTGGIYRDVKLIYENPVQCRLVRYVCTDAKRIQIVFRSAACRRR